MPVGREAWPTVTHTQGGMANSDTYREAWPTRDTGRHGLLGTQGGMATRNTGSILGYTPWVYHHIHTLGIPLYTHPGYTPLYIRLPLLSCSVPAQFPLSSR